MQARQSYETYKDEADVWCCYICNAVHNVDESDLPRAPRDEYVFAHGPKHHEMKQIAVGYRAEHARIDQSHVQIAIKLYRLREKCSPFQLHYAQRLLCSYVVTDVGDTSEANQGRILVSTYTPKMVEVDGRLMYLVHGITTLTSTYNLSLMGLPSVNICHHQNLRPTSPGYSQLRNAVATALMTRGATRAGVGVSSCSCSGCLTDFTVTAKKGEITIERWLNFGVEDPVNLIWMMHTRYGQTIPRRADNVTREGWVRDTYKSLPSVHADMQTAWLLLQGMNSDED